MNIAFKVDLKGLDEELKSLGSRAPAVLVRSLNRAGVAAKTALSRAMAKETGLRVSDIGGQIKLDKASRSTPSVALTISGRRLPLIAFKAKGPEPSRGRGAGVTYYLEGQRKRIPNAFIATVGKGRHRGVFVRSQSPERKSPGAWSLNLPIAEKLGPSLPNVFEKFLPEVQVAAQESIVKNLIHEIEFARRSSEAA